MKEVGVSKLVAFLGFMLLIIGLFMPVGVRVLDLFVTKVKLNIYSNYFQIWPLSKVIPVIAFVVLIVAIIGLFFSIFGEVGKAELFMALVAFLLLIVLVILLFTNKNIKVVYGGLIIQFLGSILGIVSFFLKGVE